MTAIDYPGIASQPVGRHRRRRRRLLLLVLLLFASAIPSVVTTTVTISVFRESLMIGDNAFALGGIDLAARPDVSLLTASGLLPGDAVTAALTVMNSGTAPLRYSLRGSARDEDGRGLGDRLTLEIRTAGTSCEAFDGSLLYAGPLGSASFGDPLPGPQAGDRQLDGPGSEIICFRASLPLAAENRYQQARTVATFTLDAELAQ